MFRRLVVSVLVGVTIAGVAPTSSASAAIGPGDALIQPGGAVENPNNSTSIKFVCPLGFILQRTSGTSAQRAKRYTTLSLHCGGSVGTRVKAPAPDIGYFGTIVFQTSSNTSLVEIDSDKLHKVSPVLKGYGAAPSGIASQAQIKIGDVVVTYTYPLTWPGTGVGHEDAVTWVNDPRYPYFGTATPDLAHGNPFVNKSNGLAYGLSDQTLLLNGANSLHYVLDQIANGTGFSLTLAL